jgi:UrcA family protein
MSRTMNIKSLGNHRNMLAKGLGGLAIGTALALAMPALASADGYGADAYGNANISQGDVHTTDGDVAPVAYSGADANGDITVSSPRHAETSDIGAPIETTYARDDVSYGDLDLSTQYGRERLLDRVSLAAQDACQRVDDETAFDSASSDAGDCYRQAMAESRPQVDGAIDQATPMAYVDDSGAGYDNVSYDNVSYTPAVVSEDNRMTATSTYDDPNFDD